ncbi:MAG TPA: GAF domain-containing sensor histidine kinase [Candidatus Nitrosotenuis sp.]|nr:GAF domain-containing sensor histidine kinase [Candidatus Nitrosotenuis sp.]
MRDSEGQGIDRGLESPAPRADGNRPLRRPRLALLGGGPAALGWLRDVQAGRAFDILALVEPEPSPELRQAAAERGIPLVARVEDAGPVDLWLDCRPGAETEPLVSGQAMRVLFCHLAGGTEPAGRERELVQQLQDRVHQLSALTALTRVLASRRQRQSVYPDILEMMSWILDLPGVLLIYRQEQEEFAALAGRGLPPGLQERLHLPLSDPLVEELMTLNRPVVLKELGPGAGRAAELCGAAGFAALAALPMQAKDRLIGFLLVLCREPGGFREADLDLLSTLTGQAGLLLDYLELYEEARTKQALVERLLARIIFAQEEERKWMAAEIHDTVAQSLVGILTVVHTCRALLGGSPERAGELLDELRGLVQESLKEIRQIMFNLRPASLDDLGLAPSLENCARRFERESGMKAHLELPSRPRRLPPLLETTIFRIAQEALTNIKKHSQAGNVWLRLQIKPSLVQLTVADDGRGLDWSEVSRRFQSGESRGLQGMRERARYLGGSLRVSSEPGKGTTLEVTVPIPREAVGSPSEADADPEELAALWKEVFGQPLYWAGKPAQTGGGVL